MSHTKKTTEQVVTLATSKFTADMTTLSDRKEKALSAFRATANELASINEGLTTTVENFETLAKYIQEQKGSAIQMISDNNKVKDKILEIIGE